MDFGLVSVIGIKNTGGYPYHVSPTYFITFGLKLFFFKIES